MARTTKDGAPAGDLGMGLVFAGAVILVLVLAFGARKLIPLPAVLIVLGIVAAVGRRRSAPSSGTDGSEPSETEHHD